MGDCHGWIASQVHAGSIGVHARSIALCIRELRRQMSPHRGRRYLMAEPDQLALYSPVSPGGVVPRDADHELADRCCRGRQPRTPAVAGVPFARGSEIDAEAAPGPNDVSGQVGDALPVAAVQFYQRAGIEREQVAEEGRQPCSPASGLPRFTWCQGGGLILSIFTRNDVRHSGQVTRNRRAGLGS